MDSAWSPKNDRGSTFTGCRLAEFRGYRAFPLGAVGKRSEEEQLRAAAERLGLKTDGLDEVELRTALQTRLSNE